MNKVKRIVTLGLALFIAGVVVLQTASPAYAEESNRGEVRSSLEQGGWTVVYGDLINEADYLQFIAAIAGSVACECPGPILEFFDSQLESQVTTLSNKLPDVAEDALYDLLVAAFDSEGTVFTRGRLELSAGVATYNRWETVIYDEPRTYSCGNILNIPCTTMERVERRVPYPNNHQPYVRYRLSNPDSGGDTGGGHDELYMKNGCDRRIQTAIHYKNLSDEWVTKGWWALDPGERAYVGDTRNTIIYIYAESIAPIADRLHWSGDDYHDSIRGSSDRYGFIEKKITTTTWGDWTESFTCN